MPNASFIGFTGTPIEKTDANTRAVFGDYISIDDIQRAVADKATEWKMSNDEFGMSNGLNFGLCTSAWALPLALVGDPKRIALVAADLVAPFDPRRTSRKSP